MSKYLEYCKRYGLIEISGGNGKTGPSLSLPAGKSGACPATSEGCNDCYAQIGRMAIWQREGSKYWRNYYRTIDALKKGGPKALANLIIKSIRAFEIYELAGARLEDIRIHDSGDWFSPSHIKGWSYALRELDMRGPWWYSRSWQIRQMLGPLLDLCEVSAGWISADRSILPSAIMTYMAHSDKFRGIAYQQIGDLPLELENIERIERITEKQCVIFPLHKEFGRIKVSPFLGDTSCPAITSKEQFKDSPLPPCLQCRKCL